MTEAKPLLPDCPKCGKPLEGRHDDGVGTIYRCLQDGALLD
jgi:hypothetical protein